MDNNLVVLIVGWGLSMLTIVGGVIVRDRYVLKLISDGDKGNEILVRQSTDMLHSRINDISRDYVRRDDLNGHLTRIEKSVESAVADFKTGTGDLTKRFDTLIAAVLASGNGHDSK